jgi:hypothetical protein
VKSDQRRDNLLILLPRGRAPYKYRQNVKQVVKVVAGIDPRA